MFGKIGAIQECVPSVSSFSPSINLSGVRTSSSVPGLSVFTLCGQAAISVYKVELSFFFLFLQKSITLFN